MFSSILIAILMTPIQSTTLTSVEDLQKQVTAMAQNKVLTLRTFSKSNHLQFTEDGQPKKPGEVGSWTIYSQILVKKVEVTDSLVRLSGVRVVHHRAPGSNDIVADRSDKNVDIEIDIKRASDIGPVLTKVFAGSEGLLPYVPNYWRQYVSGKKEDEPSTTAVANPIQRVRVGGNVMSDRLIKKVTPRYPPEAKGFRLDGVVMLMVEINETGDVEKIDIVMPAGAGLDESAVEAVSQWKYKPTLLNGKPIRVVTTVTVNYQVFR